MKRKYAVSSISSVFDEYMTAKADISAPSKASYQVTYRVFLRDNELNGEESIDTITQQLINNWRAEMLKTKKVVTVNHYLIDIRAFVNYCLNNNYLQDIKVTLCKGQEETIKYYPDDDVRKLLKKPNIKTITYADHRTYVVICMCLSTGARAGTICGIELDDVDFCHNTIMYREQKNKTVSVVPMTTTLSKVIKEFINTWERSDSKYLFANDDDSKMTTEGLRRAFDRYCAKIGVASKGVHALRHTYARHFLLSGGDSLILQRMLNHKSLDMTNHYCQIFGVDMADDAQSHSLLESMSKSNTIKRK